MRYLSDMAAVLAVWFGGSGLELVWFSNVAIGAVAALRGFGRETLYRFTLGRLVLVIADPAETAEAREEGMFRALLRGNSDPMRKGE